MNILLVDDDRSKIRSVVEFLVADCNLTRDQITVAQTGTAARECLASTIYDVLILDVLLPLREESEPDAHTALALLEDLDEGRKWQRPKHIVGLSAVEGLHTDVGDAFRQRTWTLIRYDGTATTWQGPLRNLIRYTVHAAAEPVNVEYQTDVCILTALDVPEMEQVFRLDLAWDDPTPLDDQTFIRKAQLVSGGNRYNVVTASAPRMGMVATALLAAKVIQRLRPRFIVMAGICAGVEGKTSIGDVLLINPSWNWQSGKHISDKVGPHFAAAPHQLDIPEFIRTRAANLRADKALLSGIKHSFNGTRPAHELDLKIGPVASGSAVLADEAKIKEIQSQERTLLGVEMEAYGVYAAAEFAGIPRPTAFAMKAVCDFGSSVKNDDHQAYAAFTSARVLYAFLERYLHELIPFAGH